MHTRFSVRWLLIPLSSVIVGCGSSSALPTTVTTPTSTTLTTDTFTGTVNQNGGATFAFIANAAGTVTATIKAINPDATIAIGLSLGNWNGTSCAWAVANDNALVGAAVAGTASGPSSLCVRVYDVGKISDTPVTFSVDVAHP
jgi:hypothetical protein